MVKRRGQVFFSTKVSLFLLTEHFVKNFSLYSVIVMLYELILLRENVMVYLFVLYVVKALCFSSCLLK